MPQVARMQPTKLLPYKYPEKATTDAYQPAPNLTVLAGTIMGQVTVGNADVDTLTFNNSPTGGTFTITVTNNAGTYTTPALAYNASTATVQAALQALPNIGAGNATVSGTAGSSYVITGAGTLFEGALGEVKGNGANLTGAGAQPTITSVHTTPELLAGMIKPYASGNSDGSQVPIGPVMESFSTDIEGNITLGSGTFYGLALSHQQTVPVYLNGSFYNGDLIGLDANAKTLLFARSLQTDDGVGYTRIP